MSDHVTSAVNDLAHAVNNKLGVVITNWTVSSGLVAGGVVSQTQSTGMYLATHSPFGFGLSYMEYFSALGATWISYQLITSVYDRFISKRFKRRKTDGQQTGIKTTPE